jgi:hypothetical protein
MKDSWNASAGRAPKSVRIRRIGVRVAQNTAKINGAAVVLSR